MGDKGTRKHDGTRPRKLWQTNGGQEWQKQTNEDKKHRGTQGSRKDPKPMRPCIEVLLPSVSLDHRDVLLKFGRHKSGTNMKVQE